ncbi:MAG: hypothetical protein IT357_07375 [Gemmatimonadaceae bacterium]|nr:hypothetical protein [Gemmatimonadaceae bacterium]
MYELSDYLAMVDDPRRTSAYIAALRATVRPGDHVLELGTGFGFFAVHAALAGAAHVWAIEPNDAVALGPALAAQHGVGDRITFLQRRAEQITLPNLADVLLEDLRGVFPLMGARSGILADARARLLRTDARHIALRDHLVIAPCAAAHVTSARETAHDASNDASHHASHHAPLDLTTIRARAAQGWQRVRASALRPLAASARWATLELTAAIPTDVRGTVQVTVTQDGALQGLGGWFDAELAGGASFGSGPEAGASVYDCAWFPLERTVPVRVGDGIAIAMRATHDGSDYVWRWEVTVSSATGDVRDRQVATDLGARLLAPERLARRASTAVPPRDDAVHALAALLAQVDGARSLGEIAHTVRAAFPRRFPTEREALDFAARELARLVEGDPA